MKLEVGKKYTVPNTSNNWEVVALTETEVCYEYNGNLLVIGLNSQDVQKHWIEYTKLPATTEGYLSYAKGTTWFTLNEPEYIYDLTALYRVQVEYLELIKDRNHA